MNEVVLQTRMTECVIRIGSGARKELGSLLPEQVRKVAICVDDALSNNALSHPDLDCAVETIVVPSGETNKRIGTVETLCQTFAQRGLERTDLVVGIGGGALTDVVGFAAATYHRGVDVVMIPTTLLGQVDAAIGGKNAVNLPEGKNLMGTFHQPVAVLCDLDYLDSLPPQQLLSGYGEIVKCELATKQDFSTLSLEEKISACVQWKADIVADDEFEAGNRALLNYGHTLAHGLESAGVPVTHGEAVGIGLCFAALLALRLGRIDDARRAAIVERVASYGLPTMIPGVIDTQDVVERMLRDKKRKSASDDALTFVLDGPDGIAVVPGISRDEVTAALKEFVA